MMLEPGFEKLRLAAKLNRGRFCEIRKATYYGSGDFEQTFVAKVLLPHERDREFAVQSLETEAAILCRLRDPRIVSTIDFSRTADGPTLLEEFISGQDLGRVLEHHRLLPMDLVIPIGFEIACAIRSIHSACNLSKEPLGIIHRDMTPPNVMVTETGSIKIIDFGSATSKPFRQKASTDLFRHRFAYLPPEFLAGKMMDQGMDLFSLGVTLYRLATGHLPFAGEEPAQLLVDMMADRPPAPSKFNRSVSRHENHLILKMLRKDPNRRFSDIDEVQEALSENMRKFRRFLHPRALADFVFV